MLDILKKRKKKTTHFQYEETNGQMVSDTVIISRTPDLIQYGPSDA